MSAIAFYDSGRLLPYRHDLKQKQIEQRNLDAENTRKYIGYAGGAFANMAERTGTFFGADLGSTDTKDLKYGGGTVGTEYGKAAWQKGVMDEENNRRSVTHKLGLLMENVKYGNLQRDYEAWGGRDKKILRTEYDKRWAQHIEDSKAGMIGKLDLMTRYSDMFPKGTRDALALYASLPEGNQKEKLLEKLKTDPRHTPINTFELYAEENGLYNPSVAAKPREDLNMLMAFLKEGVKFPGMNDMLEKHKGQYALNKEQKSENFWKENRKKFEEGYVWNDETREWVFGKKKQDGSGIIIDNKFIDKATTTYEGGSLGEAEGWKSDKRTTFDDVLNIKVPLVNEKTGEPLPAWQQIEQYTGSVLEGLGDVFVTTHPDNPLFNTPFFPLSPSGGKVLRAVEAKLDGVLAQDDSSDTGILDLITSKIAEIKATFESGSGSSFAELEDRADQEMQGAFFRKLGNVDTTTTYNNMTEKDIITNTRLLEDNRKSGNKLIDAGYLIDDFGGRPILPGSVNLNYHLSDLDMDQRIVKANKIIDKVGGFPEGSKKRTMLLKYMTSDNIKDIFGYDRNSTNKDNLTEAQKAARRVIKFTPQQVDNIVDYAWKDHLKQLNANHPQLLNDKAYKDNPYLKHILGDMAYRLGPQFMMADKYEAFRVGVQKLVNVEKGTASGVLGGRGVAEKLNAWGEMNSAFESTYPRTPESRWNYLRDRMDKLKGWITRGIYTGGNQGD